METIIINEKVNGLTPLHLSISKGNEQIVSILIENGADPEITDDLGNNSFHYAAKRGNLQILQLLESEYDKEIEKKPIAEALNAKNKSNYSVLHSAILGIKENQNWSAIGWLLQKGADPKLKVEKTNFSLKDKSVEDMFKEIDISYLKNYRKILEKVKNTENSEELIFSLEVNPWIK